MSLALPTLALHLALAAAPLTVSLELSDDDVTRLRLPREVVEARLRDEGFVLVAPADAEVRLAVRLDGDALELVADAGSRHLVRRPSPLDAWRVETAFELAQRLAVLAREARTFDTPLPDATRTADGGTAAGDAATAAWASDEATSADAGSPPTGRAVEDAPPAPPAVAAANRPSLGLLLRLGVATRFAPAEPSMQLAGVLPLGRLQPLAGVGLAFAQGPGGAALEVPVVLGARAPLALGATVLAMELDAGLRVHAFSGPGETVVRVDPLVQLVASASRTLAADVSLGAALGLFVSAARTHVAGQQVLWDRGAVGLTLQLQLAFGADPP